MRVEVERAGMRMRFVLAPEARPPVVLVDSDAWARQTGRSRTWRMRLLGEPARRP